MPRPGSLWFPLRCRCMTFAPASYSAEKNRRLPGPQTGVADRDPVACPERRLPLEIAIVRIHREHRAVHQHDQLLQTIHVDQQRRRVGVGEIVSRPGHASVLLPERHHGLAASSHGHDHRVAKGDGAGRITVHDARALVILPELLRPKQLARLLVDRLQAARDARGEQPVADNQRRGVGSVAHLRAASLWNVMGVACSQSVLPVAASQATTTSSRGLPYRV